MLRWLYRRVVHLHPSGFRNRFGEEMLSIFDQQSGWTAGLGLLFDGAFSLLRQWILRAHVWAEVRVRTVSPATPDGIPSFSTLDTFRPRTSAVIHGVVLSAALFCATCIAIRYSWIHVLHVQIPEVSFEPYLQVRPSASPSDLRGVASTASHEALPVDSVEKSGLISERVQVDVIPVESTILTSEPPARLSSRAKYASAVVPFRSTGNVELPLEPYTGDYVSKSPRLKISIRIRQRQLSMEIPGQPQRALSPVSQTRFVVDETSNRWVEFIPNETGIIQALDLAQNGQVIIARRQ